MAPDAADRPDPDAGGGLPARLSRATPSAGPWIRLARAWRIRYFVIAGLASVALTVASPVAGTTALVVVFGWDALAAHLCASARYAGQRRCLTDLLDRERVEAFYTESRDPPDPEREHAFGERPAAHVSPVHYLRRLTVGAVAVSRPERQRVLDVGCRDGLITAVLESGTRSIVSGDIDHVALCYVKRMHPAWHCVRLDARALPFRDEQFDLVTVTEVLEHLADPSPALAEAGRCVDRHGIVVVTTENRHGLTWAAWLNPLRVLRNVAGLRWPSLLPSPALLWQSADGRQAFYHADFSLRELSRLVSAAGLRVSCLRSYAHIGELDAAVVRCGPRLTERQVAGVLHAIDRVMNAIPVVAWLGSHWLLVARRAD